MRVGEFVGGDVSHHLRDLRESEHPHGEQHASVEDEEGDDGGRGERGRDGSVLVQPGQRDGKRRRHGKRLEDEKQHEIAKVALPDDVPHPWTVVIKPRHALVGHRAVLRAPRFHELTRRAQRAPVARPQLGVVEVREIRASAAAAAVSLHLHVVVIASRAADAVLAAFLIPELGRGAPERVDESRVAVRHAVHDGETGARGEHHQPRPRRPRDVHLQHSRREDDGVHEHDHEAEDERRAKHRHALIRPESTAFVRRAIVQVGEKPAERLVALLRRELRRRLTLHVARVQQGQTPGLRQHVRRLGFPADGGPVQRRASFLIRARDVRVAKQEELGGVWETLVRGPVQRRPTVVIVRVHVGVPSHLEVVEHVGVAVLRGDVHGVVAAAVGLVDASAGSEEKLRARERTAHARPVQGCLLVVVRGVHRGALLDEERGDRDAVVERGPLKRKEAARRCGTNDGEAR